MPEVINCEQGTEAWYQARAGIPTASQFATVLARGRGNAESRGRRTYMLKLAGERLTGQPMQSYSNGHMDRGKEMETEARDYYALRTDCDPELIGFIRSGNKGCSPDCLLGLNGMLEIKTALPHILIDHILKGDFPPEHKAQTQGQLWVAEREWVDLLIYWPNLPPFIKRAFRDDAYIAVLSDEIDRFNDELEAVIHRISAPTEDKKRKP